MDRPRRSSSKFHIDAEGQDNSKHAIQQDSGRMSLPYPLRNRMQLLQADRRFSEVAIKRKVSERYFGTSTPKALHNGAITKYNLKRNVDNGTNTDWNPKNEINKGESEMASIHDRMMSGARGTSGGASCTIHSLPTELLIIIFSYLNMKELNTCAAPVCKYWHSVAHKPVLWRSLSFTGQHVPIEEVRHLLMKSNSLTSLCIKDRDDVGIIISQICQSNRRIKSLTIERIPKSCTMKIIEAKHLHRLLKRCTNISKLVLKNIFIRSHKFYYDLGSSLPNLTYLALNQSNFFHPADLSTIADNCRRLQVLWLSGECNYGEDLHWENAYQKIFQNLSGTLTHLKFDASTIADSAYRELSRCSQLRVLILRKAKRFSTTAICAIQSLQKLKFLSINQCNNCCCYPFHYATFNLVYLMVSESKFVHDNFAECVSRQFLQLHGISLASCDQITDKGVQSILEHCHQLHFLDLYCTKNVTGSCLTLLPIYAPQLNMLLIEMDCDPVKETHLQWLNKNCPKVYVERVNAWTLGGKPNCVELKKYFNL